MLVVVTVLTLVTASSNAARILVLAPLPARSHWIIMESLFRELATRGHQLTVFSPFPQEVPLDNYTDVDLTEKFPPVISKWGLDLIRSRLPNPWKTLQHVNKVHTETCSVLEDASFQQLLKAKGQYDLLITELFGSDCFAYFSYKLNIPLVSIVTAPGSSWAADRTGLPDNPSYIPHLYVDYGPQMSLWKRMYNTYVVVYAKLMYRFHICQQTRALAEKAFEESLPPITDVIAKTSLLLINSHNSLTYSRPLTPNVVEIAGIHIKEPRPIPQDLKLILDYAKNGAIIVSFGSLVKAAALPKSMISQLLKAFSKIPQTVIFKYEEELPDLPTNVVTRKWLPQRDLVEHRNVVAAILHGGFASTVELVYVGKPIIGIPFFADQSVNIKNLVRRGAGVLLEIDSITEAKISEALSEVLNNSKYAENMKRLSKQFRDRPMTALESAVYWTEYVIRHRGAPQLRPASMDLPLYQYLLLDVLAVIVTALVVPLYVLYRCVLWLLSLILGRRNQKFVYKHKTS